MKKTVAALCAALMIGAPLASFAQPGPGQGQGPGGQQQGRPYEQSRPQQQGRPQSQARPGHGHSQGYRNPGYRPQPGMPVPHQQWQRGRVVEQAYRGDRYWVTDWRARHLYAPPRDHRWLYVNGDYVLMAIATGVIVNILAGY
ncbi:RcnB family protein [Pseudomonas citronellolis]|uniref:RcnB family protein n=1 Tax=Pseudomonas citronellolis TaxID=53408 RepID=UPI0023E3B6AF|nr:RcnB family protein [Pseudomonas citronellolis]MDF3935862.1 RcnB family protein [Pseudomonas citronellolis]